jgi:hypothetical protein
MWLNGVFWVLLALAGLFTICTAHYSIAHWRDPYEAELKRQGANTHLKWLRTGRRAIVSALFLSAFSILAGVVGTLQTEQRIGRLEEWTRCKVHALETGTDGTSRCPSP